MNQVRGRGFAGAFAAAVLTGILLMLLFALYGIYPFGTKTVVWCDMVQQGVPLLVQLRETAARGEWLGYTALDAGGMQFYGVFFFFLSNPFSFLVFLTDLRADYLVGLLMTAKLALCSGTAAFWLRQHNRKLPAGLQILLGMMYGCCGYGFFYYQNIMWLDVMALLPLLLLGMERLFRKQKPLVFFTVLCLIMLSCFYLCYMAALFVLLFGALNLRFTVPPKQRRETAFQLAGAGLTAACVTAPVWLPCFIQVMRSARTDSLIGHLSTTPLICHTEDKLAMLFCTGLAVAAIPYLWHSAEQISEGRFHCGWRIFLLLAAAVLLDPINTVWHTGSYQAFPFRWGMIPVLLLLGCAADRLSDCADRQKAGASRLFLCVLLILLASGGVFAVICYAGDDAFAYVRTLWVSLTQFAWLLIPAAAAAGGYYLIMRLRHDGRLSAALCTALMIPLFLGETLLSFHCYVGNAGGEDAQYENTFSAADAIRDDRFFRLSMASKYLHPNMIGAMGYPTLAHYTSLTRDDYLHGIKRFGYSSYWMEVTGSGGTALSDALWANRHLIGGNADLPPWTEKAWTDGRYVIGKSRLTLPTALLTDAAPEEIASLPEGSRAQVQAYLADRLLGEPELITEYVPTETAHLTLTQTETETAAQLGSADQTGIIEYELPIRGRQALYFDLSAPTDTQLSMPYFKSVTVLFNGETVSEDYPSKSTNGLLYLGTAEDSLCTVRIEVHKDFSCESFGVFGLDLNKLEAAAARAKGAEFTCENGVYTAALQTDHPQTVIFSAAYDEGFTAEVNGEPAPVFRVNGCQIAVCVPAGESAVTLKHRVSGLNAALCIAAAGILAAVIWLCIRKRLSEAHHQRLGKLALTAFQFGYCAVIAAVYIFPMTVSVIGAIAEILSF